VAKSQQKITSSIRLVIDKKYTQSKKLEQKMWVVLFVLAFLFVLGGALILLRSAKTSKIPHNVKSQLYDEDDSDSW
jgi:flagellar basal body-associated protein FliL